MVHSSNSIKIVILIFIILFSNPSFGAVIFEDNFDSQDDWTVTQPSSSDATCVTDCGISGSWNSYYNGYCWADNGLSGEPGNNLLYIDQYAGYPLETNTSHSGSGKSLTYWQESFTSFNNWESDGSIAKDLGQEYEDIYLRYYIKFKSGFELGDSGLQFKMYHVQHYDPVTNASWWQYFGSGPTNQPISSGGIARYGNTLFFYSTIRCQNNYYCNGDVLWTISSVTEAYMEGGLLDGDWHCVEYHFHRNSIIGTADASLEIWLDGVKLDYVDGYEGDSLEMNDSGSSELRGWRLVAIGGNSNNKWDNSCSDAADCEQWYAVDDIIISDTYVGLNYTDETAPTFSSANITTSGLTSEINWSEAVTDGGVDAGDINLDCSSGNDKALTLVSGDGTSKWTLSHTQIYSDDTCTLDIEVAATEIVDSAETPNSLTGVTDQTISNGSQATLTGTTNKATGGSGGSVTGGSGGSITGS